MPLNATTSLERNWDRLLRRLGPPAALEASAKRCGALKRRREISRAEDLLRLSLAYGPCGMSLRTAAAWATMQGIGAIEPTPLGFAMGGGIAAQVAHIIGAGNGKKASGGHQRIPDFMKDWTTWRCRMT